MRTFRIGVALGLALGLGPVTLILVPGCKSTPEERRAAALDDLRAYLRDSVNDPARSRDALALLDEIDRLTGEVEELRSGFHADIATLNRDHATEDAALLARAEKFRQEREPLRAQAIAKRMAMRGVLTADEWSGYADRELSLLKASRDKGGVR
jgi:hypothetical protein